MGRMFRFGSAFVCVAVIAMACGKSSPSPTSPSASAPGASASVTAAGVAALADGSAGGALKVSSPTPVSPINGQKPDLELILVARNATALYAPGTVPLSYVFEILTPSGVSVHTSPVVPGNASGTTSYKPDASLNGDQAYQWRARAQYQSNAGPWSTSASFIAPQTKGYIQGSELYDPLINGTTVGTVHGPVTFIPGVGARLDTFDSWITYTLPTPLQNGEYSMLVTGVETNTEGNKTRIMAMAEGYGDVSDNPARMTVEKRGDSPPGAIAWRFITSADQIDTVGAERVVREFDANVVYLWQADWHCCTFWVRIVSGGANGNEIYSFGKDYEGFYRPDTHVIYAGGGPARGGPESQTVPGMIVRQIWVSERPRPAFANK